jgi:pimeloyl-ACP methyl ester carboxylesterase
VSVELTPRVARWRDRGTSEECRGRRIHVFRREGRDPLLLLLHGFPSSSYDWRRLLEEEREQAALAFDYLGFGLSEKPADHEYTLGEQADIAEELVRRHRHMTGRSSASPAERPRIPVFLVAHDMGTSVATELMARDINAELEMDVRGALLFNGSVVQEAASPTIAQRLLRGPLGPVFARLSVEPFFRQQLGSVFSPDHPLTDQEAEDQWCLISGRGGIRLGHKLISYVDERERYAERWHGALRDWPKPVSLVWGMLDPVATERVVEALLSLRPSAPLTRLEDIGHYPQIEDPSRLAGALREALAA